MSKPHVILTCSERNRTPSRRAILAGAGALPLAAIGLPVAAALPAAAAPAATPAIQGDAAASALAAIATVIAPAMAEICRSPAPPTFDAELMVNQISLLVSLPAMDAEMAREAARTDEPRDGKAALRRQMAMNWMSERRALCGIYGLAMPSGGFALATA